MASRWSAQEALGLAFDQTHYLFRFIVLVYTIHLFLVTILLERFGNDSSDQWAGRKDDDLTNGRRAKSDDD
jgi:hypothetical protein